MSGSLAGVFGHVITLDDVNFGLSNGSASGEFYTDKGVKLGRFVDRLFVGAAADNPGKSDALAAPTDWLTPTTLWPVYSAQMASLSRVGSIGVLGGARTSDTLRYGNSSAIGVMGIGIGDDTTNPTNTSTWGFYGEGWRLPGVDYSLSFAMELNSINMGPAIDGSHPYQQNYTGGTVGLQLACGGGQTGANDAEAGIVFASNEARWGKGIIFGATSLRGTDGSTGFGTAIAMARLHGLAWYTSDGRQAARHYSSVTNATLGNSISHQDNAIVFLSATAETLAIQNGGSIIMPTTGAYLEMGSYSEPSAPGIDFHSSGNGDFDSRILASGGDPDILGQGSLDFYAASATFRGNLTTFAGTTTTFNSAVTCAGALVTTYSVDFLYTTAFHSAGVFDYAAGGRLNLINIPSFASNVQAASAGLNYGDVYRNLTTQALDIRT